MEIRFSTNPDVSLSVNDDKRTITGVATVLNVEANALGGRIVFKDKDALKFADDLRRVKLLTDHDSSKPVGYATSADWEDESLIMSFYLPPGAAGDAALAEAAAGLRDGLSVGVWAKDNGYKYEANTGITTITDGDVREVSLCAIPAFDDARVRDVKAQADPENSPVGNTQIVKEEPMPTNNFNQAPPVKATAAPVTAATAANLVFSALANGGGAAEVKAALSDILPATDKGEAYFRPAWLGELWSARRVERPLIDSFTHNALPATGTKVYGYQLTKRPKPAAYEGKKQPIPSEGGFGTKRLEAAIERSAGGWDIDRIFIDRGEPGFLEAMWQAAVEEYQLLTEANFTAALLEGATSLDGEPKSLLEALELFGREAARIGANVGSIAFAPDVWSQLAALKRDEVPWWMGSGDGLHLAKTEGNINGLKLSVKPELEAGTVLAGDPRAAAWYEDSQPLRIQVIDLPNGGVDLGLFGYHAKLINDPKSLWKVTVSSEAA